MIERVKKKNNIFLIKIFSFFGLIPEQTIRITDINSVIKFSWHKGLKVVDNETKFVEMTSESIFFLLIY